MELDPQKLVQVINYFAIKDGGKVNYTKVLKLIYFSDKYMLCRYGRMLTNDRYAAIKRGPVPSVTKDIAEAIVKDSTDSEDFPVSEEYCKEYIQHVDSWNIKSLAIFDEDFFSDAEIEAMEAVYEKFGLEDQWTLCETTHNFHEWKRHKVDGEQKRFAPMAVIDFFENSDKEDLDRFFNPSPKDVQIKKEFFMSMANKFID